MKGSLKIIAAVLVMLFCLSPLSAVDFNQDDANALNSTNTLNSSVDETNELNSNASKKYEKTESNIALQKSDCNLYIHVNNIYANQTEDIEIQCDPHYYGDIKIQIDDGEFIRANVSNGYGITRVGGLSYGFHTAKVICEETDSHTRSEASADFEVYSCDPHLNVKINDILIGDDAIIEVTTEASITDYVNVVVDDNRFVSMKINEGKGSTKISDLEPGNHTAKVSFKGNDIYHSSEQTVHFNVIEPSPKSDCCLNVAVDDIYANQTEDIEIQCDPHYYGDIKIQIDDGEFIRANVSNGYGITRVGGLSYGFHTAKVICEETDSHTRSEASADFEVYSCDPHLNVKINDILIGDDAIIEVTTEASITDYVNVVVDDNRFISMKINEGKGSTKISDLEPGNHTAKVSFKGNDIYHSSEQTVHFNVIGPSPKSDCCLNVAVDDIYVNQNAKIMISTDPHYQGHIKVQVDDGEFITVQLSNGHGSTTVSGLEAGPHTVKAIAEETDSYLASEASTDFEVKKAE